jgi:exonuclease III
MYWIHFFKKIKAFSGIKGFYLFCWISNYWVVNQARNTKVSAVLFVTLSVTFSLVLPIKSWAHIAQCNTVFSKRFGLRPLKDLHRLRLITFNLENFHIDTELYDKPSKKIQNIVKVLLQEKADIVVLQEVLNRQSLRFLATHFLKNRYHAYFAEGIETSTKGLHNAFLIKKDLGVHYKVRSFVEDTIFDSENKRFIHVFPRDYPTLILWPIGGQQEKPFLIVHGHHGKANARNKYNIQAAHFIQRKQIHRIKEITLDLKAEYGQQIPMIIAGDFNINLLESSLMHHLSHHFQDAFFFSPVLRSDEERLTHFRQKDEKIVGSALDTFLLNAPLQDHVLSIRRGSYFNEKGEKILYHQSDREIKQLPSDHYPVILDLSVEPLLRAVFGNSYESM